MQEVDAHVYAVVRPNSPHNARLTPSEQLTIVPADLSDYARLDEMIGTSCDVFFHLAWQGGRYDFAAQYGNIADTLGALDAAACLGCHRFIGIGSQAEYGRRTQLTTEACCPHPRDAYGAAKLATCTLSRIHAADLGMDWIWGRVFSLYGRYEQEGRMLPTLVQGLKAGQSFVFSSSGTQNWDYLYAEDAAEALFALAEGGRAGEIYNVAHGDYRPLRDFVTEVQHVIASQGNISYGVKVGHVSLQPSVEKLCHDTGWKPKTRFVDGLRMGYGL